MMLGHDTSKKDHWAHSALWLNSFSIYLEHRITDHGTVFEKRAYQGALEWLRHKWAIELPWLAFDKTERELGSRNGRGNFLVSSCNTPKSLNTWTLLKRWSRSDIPSSPRLTLISKRKVSSRTFRSSVTLRFCGTNLGFVADLVLKVRHPLGYGLLGTA